MELAIYRAYMACKSCEEGHRKAGFPYIDYAIANLAKIEALKALESCTEIPAEELEEAARNCLKCDCLSKKIALALEKRINSQEEKVE